MFDLARHKAKEKIGFAVYSLKSEDEWFAIIANREHQVFDSHYDEKGCKHTCSWVLIDPSESMSWEELKRPTQRSQLIDPTITKDIGCGNVRLVCTRKFTSLLGARLDSVRMTFSPDLVTNNHV